MYTLDGLVSCHIGVFEASDRCAAEKALRSIRELDCMSVRAMNAAWSPSHNMLHDDILKIGGSLSIFATVASAVNRSVILPYSAHLLIYEILYFFYF